MEKQRLAREYLTEEKYDEAIALYEQCIYANPEEMSNYWELGLALLLSGEEAEAQALWLQVIFQRFDANTAELIKVLSSEAIHRIQSGKYQQAEKIYGQVIELNQNDSEAYNNLGVALISQGKLDEAIDCYQQAIKLEPNNDRASNNLGAAFQAQGKLEEAKACYQQCLTLKPEDPSIYNYLGRVFQSQGQTEEAIACYQKSLLLKPSQPITINDLGTIFHAQGKLEQAISYYQQAINLDNSYALAHHNLGVLLMEKYQFEKALDCFNRTLEIEPNYAHAHLKRGLILLKQGDYKPGFSGYEWRWRGDIPPPRFFSQPLWDGSSLQGRTILLYSEQGFGDTIHFVRYAPMVKACGGIVVVECQPELVRLLKSVSGIDTTIATGTTLPEFDVQASLMSLPYILGTTLETLPSRVPYLDRDPSCSFKLQHSQASFKVGIVWAGSADNTDDRNRSCSLNHFLPILNTRGVAFYSLQKGSAVAELTQLSPPVQVENLDSQLNDFADTAEVVAQLDLVITVDTAVAHLAGALAKPVWLLLSFDPDWRWMLEREDSPWYPTMRLFRQRQPGDWVEVFARVEAALGELMELNLDK